MERGFFDEKLFAEYLCKAKMSSNVHKIADYLEQSCDFTSISSHYAAAEISVPLTKWKKARGVLKMEKWRFSMSRRTFLGASVAAGLATWRGCVK